MIDSVSAKTENIYFGSLIRTSLCSLFVFVFAVVVLAVIYLGHDKICHVM